MGQGGHEAVSEANDDEEERGHVTKGLCIRLKLVFNSESRRDRGRSVPTTRSMFLEDDQEQRTDE